MAEAIKMPRMSDTMEEGVIAAWHKKVGDKVKPGDLLAEVETDKATMELESYQEGTILYIGAEKGSAVKVNGILAIIGKEGEDYKALLGESTVDSQQTTEVKKEDAKVSNEQLTINNKKEPVAKVETNAAPNNLQTAPDARLKASPLAKKIAAEKGIDLNALHGTGDEGRIVKRDIEEFVPQTGNGKQAAAKAPYIMPTIAGKEGFEEVAVSQMRKTIAKRLAESKFSAPHFYLTTTVNMDRTIDARAQMNEVLPVKISYNDIIIKAAAAALLQHPAVNSSWLGDKIRTHHHIHIGVAVAVEDGLLVPVIRFANEKSLAHISTEVKQLAEKAKNKKLQPAEMQGNTFTISNLGMFDIDEFTAIINPPDSCILAVGSIKSTPVVKDGNVVIANLMKLTLSCDHRSVDGATGSRFLQTLKLLLEEPVRLLV
jgi:pyruvate dehydrogenase E2 component (dihydrolipoamide acetyltransferase)